MERLAIEIKPMWDDTMTFTIWREGRIYVRAQLTELSELDALLKNWWDTLVDSENHTEPEDREPVRGY